MAKRWWLRKHFHRQGWRRDVGHDVNALRNARNDTRGDICDEKDEKDIQNKLANFFTPLKIPNHAINVVFDTIVIPDEGCIMINTRKNAALNQLQKNIVSALKEYSHYTAPELELYEKNFIPHITIARDVRLVKEDLDALRSDCSFRAEIRDITCIFVREQTLKESQNSNNKTIYQL